jgi:hypothetical protein
VIRDPDGLGWVVEYGTGRTWRIVTEPEIGFEARGATREPSEAEEREAAKRHYVGPGTKARDPWGQFSPFGRTDAVHVAPEGLRLLRHWRNLTA